VLQIRKFAGSISFIDIKSFRSQHGRGVDSASNRNEYQEHFREGVGGGVKATGACKACAVVTKFGKLNFPEPSVPLRTCNGTELSYILEYNRH